MGFVRTTTIRLCAAPENLAESPATPRGAVAAVTGTTRTRILHTATVIVTTAGHTTAIVRARVARVAKATAAAAGAGKRSCQSGFSPNSATKMAMLADARSGQMHGLKARKLGPCIVSRSADSVFVVFDYV